MTLDERKYMILQAIIDDYIMTAVPVGSRTISRKSGVGFSPATIRNEMSDLEELGYLDQPHTSAGRVPSDKAYRLYVDQLLRVARLSNDEKDRISERLAARSSQIENVIRRAADVMSNATKYTSVIIAPQMSTLRIRNVQLVQVSENLALIVIVTNAGIVKDAVIHIPEKLTEDDLYTISKALTERLKDQPLEKVRQIFAEMLRDMGHNRRLLAEMLNVIENRMEESDTSDIVVGGQTNLLNYPEYNDVEKARNLLQVLDSREKLKQIISSGGGMDIGIRIGSENGLPDFNDLSVLTVSYRIGDKSNGTLGIIGPTRMNYNRAISVLEFMSRTLTDLLSERI